MSACLLKRRQKFESAPPQRARRPFSTMFVVVALIPPCRKTNTLPVVGLTRTPSLHSVTQVLLPQIVMTASSKSPNCIRSLDAMNDNDATAKNDGDTANDSVEAVRNIFADTPVSPNDQTEPLSISKARSSILRLSMLVGNLCSILFRSFPLDGVVTTTASPSLYATPGLQESMAEIVSSLMCTAALLSIDLETAILKKMELNNKKYPVELCKVRN